MRIQFEDFQKTCKCLEIDESHQVYCGLLDEKCPDLEKVLNGNKADQRYDKKCPREIEGRASMIIRQNMEIINKR